MRTVFCACGHRLIAVDDSQLFQQYRSHVDTTHPDCSVTNEQIRAVIVASAHDYEKELTRGASTSVDEPHPVDGPAPSYAFHVGDRVVTSKPLVGVSVGTGGIVVKVYAADCYAVLLDGLATPCFLFRGDLRLMPVTS